MLALDLPPQLEKRLRRIAEETGKPVAYFAEKAIAEYVDEIEDIALAEARLAALQAGQSETVALGDLMKRYGLAD